VDKNFSKSKVAAARKLQASVHENYRVFITTSKEIASMNFYFMVLLLFMIQTCEHIYTDLEMDMLELRNHLTAVNATLQGLQQATFNFDSTQY